MDSIDASDGSLVGALIGPCIGPWEIALAREEEQSLLVDELERSSLIRLDILSCSLVDSNGSPGALDG